MKYIKKKSVAQLPRLTGSIVDTWNVDDTTTNAPSMNLIKDLTGSVKKIKMGSKVITVTDSNAGELFTIDELVSLFGVDSLSSNNITGFVTNGDETSYAGDLISTFFGSNHYFYVRLSETITGSVNVRVNYVLFYME